MTNKPDDSPDLIWKMLWCPCHGWGGTYPALQYGYTQAEDRTTNVRCLFAFERKMTRP